MGHWNYRIIYHAADKPTKRSAYYGLHEVYYDKRRRVMAWTVEPILTGDTSDEIASALAQMQFDVCRFAGHQLYESQLIAEQNTWHRRLARWWTDNVQDRWELLIDKLRRG